MSMNRHSFSSLLQPSGMVDRLAGVIYGVAVITVGKAKGHGFLIDKTTLEQMRVCAETYKGGLKVMADHGSGVFSAAGYLRNFRIDGIVLRADLFCLESESNRGKLLEMAEKIPDTFGLSVAFSGVDEIVNGMRLARCTELYSCDLVSNPAGNPNGLFSDPTQTPKMNPEEIVKAIESARADMAAFAARLQKLEEGFACGASKNEMQAVQASVTELSKKIEDRKELSAEIAKSFSAVLNVKPTEAPTAAPAVAAPAAPAVENFEAKVAALKAEGKSRGEAVRLAIAKHPELYKEFKVRQANGEVKAL